MKRLLITSVVLLMTSGALLAEGPWSLFGGARAQKQSAGGNPWVINLTSNADSPYSGVAFQQPNGKLLFSQIAQLSADYDVVSGGCGGGSPRFSIAVDEGGGVTRHVFVYIGNAPNFDCPASGWQNTGNLITSTELRFDSTQLGGPFYGTYDQALARAGSFPVVGVSLVIDSAWMFPSGEVILVDNVTVNNFVLRAKGFDK